MVAYILTDLIDKGVYMFPAIASVGSDVVVLKDNKVFAKGRSVAMRERDFVSIRLQDEDFNRLFADMTEDHKKIVNSIGHVRFDPTTGHFICLSLDLSELYEKIDELFDGTLVVDAFNLRWGMVPDYFKDAEGYRESANAASATD
jgi:hypothetical protein